MAQKRGTKQSRTHTVSTGYLIERRQDQIAVGSELLDDAIVYSEKHAKLAAAILRLRVFLHENLVCNYLSF